MIKAHQQSILCTGKKQQAAGISNVVLQTVLHTNCDVHVIPSILHMQICVPVLWFHCLQQSRSYA